MASGSLEEVELGFAEEPDDCSRLTSAYFPSKVGGKPAWLDSTHLPVPEDLVCRRCGKPLIFLLQVYAPIDHLTHCYHRTLYVFCCREASCHSRNFTEPFVVLRCNLPQVNPFYDGNISGLADGIVAKSKDTDDSSNKDDAASKIYDSIAENVTENNFLHSDGDAVSNSGDNKRKNLVQGQQQKGVESNHNPVSPLCVVCGCSGPKRCAKCHAMNYCSREHQVIHWKAGHKKHCGNDMQSVTCDGTGGVLFKEFEIVTEPEPPIKITPDKSEEERLKDYHKFVQQHSGRPNIAEIDKVCLDDVENAVRKDKQFMTFKKRIAVEPDQVIRYQRCGVPLWISSENLPNQIPDCKSCGSKRVFEFQVMPQLLYYLKLDSTQDSSIDWGTLAVYCCERSCTATGSGAYQSEFLWKQDPSMY